LVLRKELFGIVHHLGDGRVIQAVGILNGSRALLAGAGPRHVHHA
jgi:hypothetical protein